MVIEMEMKNKFKMSEKGDKIVLMQEITKIMDLKESVKELSTLRNEKVKLVYDLTNLEKAVTEGFYKKQIEKVKENITVLTALEAEWSGLIAPRLNAIKEEIEKKVKEAKKKRNYVQIKDVLERQKVVNEIMARVAAEEEFDMTHPLIIEIKKGFNEL